MSPLQTALDEYLAVRRALGNKIRSVGSLLQNFVAYADRADATYITTELCLKWAMQPTGVQPFTWAARLGMVRQFARYSSATEPRTVIPPPDLLPRRRRRPTPYIYRDTEITRLLDAAKQLPSVTGLWRQTFVTLLRLSVTTGMRCNPISGQSPGTFGGPAAVITHEVLPFCFKLDFRADGPRPSQA
jgi:integrase/recombinase XerD